MITAEIQDLTPIIDFLEKDRRVKFAYLFGSRARGRAGSLSDTDIAIYLDGRVKPGRYRLKLMDALTKILKTNDLDLVVLNQATPLLRHEVIKYGRPLKDDALRRVPFEADVIREYLDTAHLRQIQRSALAEHIRKGEAFGPERSRRRQTRKTS
ncbi:MAG: type VII toxin-antitoxin system MntA family adenylyltransferase antitoxin [Syntrophales bacterium]